MKAKRNKKIPTEAQMEALAETTGLTYDGNGDDRLFAETVHTNSETFSEAEYDAMEEAINSYSVVGNGFEVGAWNDSSGYQYWNVRQQESNYIQVTAYITDISKVDPTELKKAVERAYDKFYCDYSRN